MQIREARRSDVDDLVALETQSFSSDNLSRRSFLALVRSPSACVLVAREGGRLLGYALMLIRRGGRTARLYSIAVDAATAGRGIGSALLAEVEDAARRCSAERLRLEVRADNRSAIRFYERHGFQADGERPGYYRDGMRALLYSRPLSTPSAASGGGRLRRAA